MVTTEQHGVRVLEVAPYGPVVCDESAALDVIGDAFAERADLVALPIERLCPEFFRLRSGVAGAVVQKFVNHRLRLVVVGDPDHHGATSGPVDEWMSEANRSGELWFVADATELGRRLGATR